MQPLQRQQMDLFKPEPALPSIPAGQRGKLVSLIKRMLTEAMAGLATQEDGDQAREVSGEQDHS